MNFARMAKVANIYLDGIVGNDITLAGVRSQIKNAGEYDRICIRINSEGGEVREGFAIYDELQHLEKPIDTHVSGKCYSIAVLFALLGETRTMNQHAEIGIHNPFFCFFLDNADAGELRQKAENLDKTKDDIVNIYTQKTKLTADQVNEMMDKTTIMDAEQAVQYGFATTIKQATKIENLIHNHFSKKNMSNATLPQMFNALGNTIAAQIKKIVGQKNLLLQDATGNEIDFPDLTEGDSPKVGDKATIDGKPAEGEVTMPDGATFVFEGGILKEIKPKTEDEKLAEENNALKQQINALKSENDTLKKGQEEMKNALVGIQKEFNTLKANVSSQFSHEPTLQNDPAVDRNQHQQNIPASRITLLKK